MKPPNTINKAAGKHDAFLCSKIVFFVLLSSVRHEGFGWHSCHIEIHGKKLLTLSQNLTLCIKLRRDKGGRRRWLNRPTAQKRERGLQPLAGGAGLAPRLVPAERGVTLVPAVGGRALQNHGSRSTPRWRQGFNQQQLVFANGLS